MSLARLVLTLSLLGATPSLAAGRTIERDVGPMVDRTIAVTPFRAVAVAGPYEVVVRAGGALTAHARGGSALLDETVIRVEDGTLKIEPKRHDGQQIHWRGQAKTIIEVSGAGPIASAAMAGSGSLRLDAPTAPSFKADMAGSGDLAIPRLDSASAEFRLAGSGDLSAAGRTGRLSVSLAGSGAADLSRLASRDASLTLAGSGSIAARSSGSAGLALIGSGDIDVTGGARCAVTRQGSGHARCS